MTTEEKDPYQIEASPTKEFFIDMLVRDISLLRAILDLVDNSIDGAHRCQENGDYSRFWVNINFSQDMFKISDNCGGIPIEIARDYAFRFGRPDNMKVKPTPGSIGRFGVGMKRTLFKLGKNFKVTSKTANSSFMIEEDIDQWKLRADDWHFRFNELQEGVDIDKESIGTIIEATNLFENIASTFALANFETNLKEEMQTAQALVMEKGLKINLNGIPLLSNPIDLLNSEVLSPGFFSKSYADIGTSPVNVKIYAGVSDREKSRGGWYVFCNGRMVLESDQTSKTGWEEDNDMPMYHGTYAYFRGYVFFECDDAGLLPWTTTKTGIDEDSSIYKAVKLEMIALMKPVIDFLKRLETERRDVENEDERELANTIKSALPIVYSNIAETKSFSSPTIVLRKEPTSQRIQYSVPFDKFEKAKAKLKARSITEVGEKTFKYYYQMECE